MRFFQNRLNKYLMRKATFQDKPRAIEILSESFKENQSIKYVVKNDQAYESRIKSLMNYSFDMCLRYGEVFMSDDNNGCVLILWSEKKRTVPVWDIKLAFYAIGLTRVFKVLKRESKIKANHPSVPFLYLWFIGVDPSSQRSGIGTKLLNEVIDIGAKEGKDIYLETSTLSNIPWYEKHGFKIFKKLEFSYNLFLLKKTSKSAA